MWRWFFLRRLEIDVHVRCDGVDPRDLRDV
jgi:hypothetical protein